MLPVSAAFAHGDWNPTDKDAAMTNYQDNQQPDTPQGKLLRLGEQREIAIYSYAGTAWVAEFNNDKGVLFAAGTWLISHAHERAVRRRMQDDAITPLPDEYAARIERLHREADPDLISALVDGLARTYGLIRATSSKMHLSFRRTLSLHMP